MEKHVATRGVALDRAVGLRLTFRQPPPIDCFSNQFLFYLNSTMAAGAYQTWSHLIPQSRRCCRRNASILKCWISATKHRQLNIGN